MVTRRSYSGRADSRFTPASATSPQSIPLAQPSRRGGRIAAFTLIEVVFALGIVAFGLAGVYAMAMQAGKFTSAAEEEALAYSGLEQRIDQLRELGWPPLTDGTGITGSVFTARPAAMAGMPIMQEALTVSGYDITTQTLQGTWPAGSAPAVSFTTGAALNTAAGVKVIAGVTWTGRRTGRPQTRSLVTVISRGGISKSVLP